MNRAPVPRKESTRMATLEPFRVSHIVINLSLLFLMTTATIREIRPFDGSKIREFVERHMAEVKEASPINMIIHPKVDPAILNTIVSEYTSLRPISLVQEDGFTRPCNSNGPKLHNIVGIFKTIDDIDPIKWKTLYKSTWNPRSKMAIWITKPADPFSIKNIFDRFWSLGSLNIVLLVIDDPARNITIHTYDPFWVNKRRRGREDRGRVSTVSATERLYPDKMKNLHRSSIKVSMYPTILPTWLKKLSQLENTSDTEVLQFLSSWMNFTIKLKGRPMNLTDYCTMRLPNGTSPGVSYDLITNFSEVLGNSQLWGNGCDCIESVEPYARIRTTALVPKPKMIPGILRIFRSWDINTFSLLILVSIISAIYMHIKGIQCPVLNTFRLIIYSQFYRIGSRLSERMFAFSFIVFACLFIIFQQSYFFRDMTDPPYYKGIRTLEELANSELKVVTDSHQLSIMNLSGNAIKEKIAKRVDTSVNFKVCALRLWAGENIACITDPAVFMTLKHNDSGPTSESIRLNFKGHVIRESVGEYWRTMLVKQGFPYLPKFNDGLRRLMEHGLIGKWMARDLERFKPKAISDDDFIPLNFSHFDGPFKIFFIGLAIATCILIIEIIVYRVRSKCYRLFDEFMC